MIPGLGGRRVPALRRHAPQHVRRRAARARRDARSARRVLASASRGRSPAPRATARPRRPGWSRPEHVRRHRGRCPPSCSRPRPPSARCSPTPPTRRPAGYEPMHVNFGLVPATAETRARQARAVCGVRRARAARSWPRGSPDRDDLFGPEVTRCLSQTRRPDELVDRVPGRTCGRARRLAATAARLLGGPARAISSGPSASGVDPIASDPPPDAALSWRDGSGGLRAAHDRAPALGGAVVLRVPGRRGTRRLGPVVGARDAKIPSRLPTSFPTTCSTRCSRRPTRATPTGLRDRAILELLYATGARVSEVVGLRRRRRRLRHRVRSRLCGKGAKERIVPVYEVALEACATTCATAGRALGIDRSRGPPLPLHARAAALGDADTPDLQAIRCQRPVRRSGISPHSMRHTFATHLVEAARICARFRSCWAMLPCLPPRFILT